MDLDDDVADLVQKLDDELDDLDEQHEDGDEVGEDPDGDEVGEDGGDSMINAQLPDAHGANVLALNCLDVLWGAKSAEEVTDRLPDFEMTPSWTVVRRSTGAVLSKTRAIAGRRDMSLRTGCQIHQGKCKLHIMAADFQTANAISMLWVLSGVDMDSEAHLRASESAQAKYREGGT